MKLETAVELWTREAIAHEYIGFMVIDNDGIIGRIFMDEDSEFEQARKNCKDNNIIIISEVWV